MKTPDASGWAQTQALLAWRPEGYSGKEWGWEEGRNGSAEWKKWRWSGEGRGPAT